MSGRGLWILLALGALVIVVVANLQALALGYAVLMSEKRPALLKDVAWGQPAPAFRQRFAPGVAERELVDWLRGEGYTVYSRQRRALGHIASLPCNESVEVNWSVDAAEKLTRADAVVREAGCL